MHEECIKKAEKSMVNKEKDDNIHGICGHAKVPGMQKHRSNASWTEQCSSPWVRFAFKGRTILQLNLYPFLPQTR